MQTKLTLRLERGLIDKAKRYSKKIGKPVSSIVADYFRSIDNEKPEHDFPITPLVKSLQGSLRGSDVEITDYHKYLERKYL
ncbi:MAG: antitoxin [Deltaproteobacteria bacterium]|nr:antitoxin [Deltaproteobacteria bacterium]MBW2632552.1 antitoxin [Deltaproteobacteria bacterium]